MATGSIATVPFSRPGTAALVAHAHQIAIIFLSFASITAHLVESQGLLSSHFCLFFSGRFPI